MLYILKTYKASIATTLPRDPDCIIIDLDELNTQLVNIYNATHPNIPSSILIIQRDNILPTHLARKAIILGDFNTHHPWWDPLRPQSSNSAYLINLIQAYNLELLNSPGEGTFYRPNMATPSVLDLSFATRGIINKVQDWQVLPDLGSDHFGILFTICNPRARTRHSLPLKEDSSRFDTKKANWNLFKETLISSTIGP